MSYSDPTIFTISLGTKIHGHSFLLKQRLLRQHAGKVCPCIFCGSKVEVPGSQVLTARFEESSLGWRNGRNCHFLSSYNMSDHYCNQCFLHLI